LAAFGGQLTFGFAAGSRLGGCFLLVRRELELAGGGDAQGDLAGGFAACLAVGFPGLFFCQGVLGVGVGAVDGGGGSGAGCGFPT